MRNERGISMLECLAGVVILGILVQCMLALVVGGNRQIVRLTKKIQEAAAVNPTTPPRALNPATVVHVTGSTCKQLDAVYWGKAHDSNTLGLYKDVACRQLFGTLNRITNESWFNSQSETRFLVFQNQRGELNVLLEEFAITQKL